MPLNWSISAVENWQEIADDPKEQTITEVIVLSTGAVGLGSITEKNWPEFALRFVVWQGAHGGSLMRANGEDYWITPGDIRRRVGLGTNQHDRNRMEWTKWMVDEIRSRWDRE